MSDYTPRDHIYAAIDHIGEAVQALNGGRDDPRDALIHARASITRALLLIPPPDDDREAA